MLAGDWSSRRKMDPPVLRKVSWRAEGGVAAYVWALTEFGYAQAERVLRAPLKVPKEDVGPQFYSPSRVQKAREVQAAKEAQEQEKAEEAKARKIEKAREQAEKAAQALRRITERQVAKEERAKAKAAKEQERAQAKAAREAQKHAKLTAQAQAKAAKAQPEPNPRRSTRKSTVKKKRGYKGNEVRALILIFEFHLF